MESKIEIHATREGFVEGAVEKITESILTSLDSNETCHVALTGGNTPRDIYAMLAQPPFRERIPWKRIHLYWGDERMVPPDHPDSNYGMAKETLLSNIMIPQENIHRIEGEKAPEQAASEYAELLGKMFDSRFPVFDLLLLGLGDDGHIASLFPGRKTLQEESKLVVADYVDKLQAWRVSVTLPVINHAHGVLFLVAGKDKVDIVRDVVSAEEATSDIPATLVQPASGELYWILDSEAAAQIDED